MLQSINGAPLLLLSLLYYTYIIRTYYGPREILLGTGAFGIKNVNYLYMLSLVMGFWWTW